MNWKKILKRTGIVVLILATLFGIFHLWFINRSVKLLENFVSQQSQGKYQLHIQKLRYNYAKLIFQLEKPTLTCLDTTASIDKYDVAASMVTINLKQLLPLIFKKELRFDSVFVNAPDIRITHQKQGKTSSNDRTGEVNISEDMFRTYASLQNVLGQLQVDQFAIRSGSFIILNTVDTSKQQPLKIAGINFTIKGLNIKPTETPTYDPLAITDSIGLSIAGQHIVFPDGKKSITFKSFAFNSVLGAISLDSFQVISRSDTTANNFNVFAEKLALKKFRLVNRNGADFTQIDSVFFTRPIAKLVLESSKEKRNDSTANIATTLRKVVETVTGNGAINYIGINNVNFDITTLKNDKESRFKFVQDKLEIGDILLNKDSIAPVTVGSLRFGLKRYTNYFNDSAYFIQFDSIRILNGQLALYNFELQSTSKAPQLQRVNIPVLMLSGFDWYRYIFENQVALKSIALYDPQIVVSAPAGGGKKGNNQFDFRKQFFVEHVLLQKANIKVLFSKNEYAQVKNLSMDANTAPWFKSPNFTAAMAMLQGTSATEILLQKSGWNAKVVGPKLSDTGVALIPTFSIVNKQKQINAKGENLRIAKLQVNEKDNKVSIGSISWKSLVADVLLPEQKAAKQDSAAKSNVYIDVINGGPVKLHLHNSKTDANVDLTSVHSGRLAVKGGKLDSLNDFSLKGNSWKISNKTIAANGGTFSIIDQQQSVLNRIEVNTNPAGEKITASIPEISFVGNMLKVANQEMMFDNVKVVRPTANIVVGNPTAADVSNTKAATDFPLIELKKAEIINPDISFTQINRQSNQTILKLHLSDAYFAAGVYSTGNEFNLRNVAFQAATLSFNQNDSLVAGLAKNGKLHFSAGSFSLYKHAPDAWKFSEAALTLTNAELKAKRDSGKRDTVMVPSFGVKHFAASTSSVKDWRKLVLSQPALQLENVSIRYRNNDNIFMIDDLNTTLGSNKMSMASFFYHPQLAEEAFIKAHYYETDFIRTKTGKLTIYDLNRQAFIRDSMIRIRHISIDDVDFRDTRDKTPPFLANVIKPLPVSLINKIPFPLDIDSITLQNAKIQYKEVSEKTGNPGTIFFSKVQSQFLNLKNRNQTIRDTFQWNSHALMMDSMPFFLGLKAAYKDSADKLQLTVRLSPTELPLLNPFFAPLEGISFKSGHLDTLELVALANDYIGHGTMRFYYHDLHINFINPSDTAKKGFFKSVVTFLANSLVLKKNNHHRVGTVYFERIRDRSIFNYIVKMVLSGMKTSIGAQKSKKLESAYDKKLAETGWKPLEE